MPQYPIPELHKQELPRPTSTRDVNDTRARTYSLTSARRQHEVQMLGRAAARLYAENRASLPNRSWAKAILEIVMTKVTFRLFAI